DEAERCSRVALLHDGRLLAVDAPGALRRGLGGQVIEVVTDTTRPPLEALARLPGVRDVQAFGERAHVRVDSLDPQAVGAVRAGLERQGIAVIAARPLMASLED